jgi:hypothetical protein
VRLAGERIRLLWSPRPTSDLLVVAEPDRDLVSEIERDVIPRGIFTSQGDLARKLLRYIRHYNENAIPIK